MTTFLALNLHTAKMTPLPALARRFENDGKIISNELDDAATASLSDHFRMLRRLSVETRDETCQLSLRPLTPGTTDFVVETLQGADNLEDAMRSVARTYNIVHGGAYNRVERRRDRLVYFIDDRDFPYAFDTATGASHALIEGVLIFLHVMLSLAVEGDLSTHLRTIKSRRPVRTPADGLLTFWDAPVRCHASRYSLEYDAAAGNLPVRADVAEVARAAYVYEEIAAIIAARGETVRKDDFAARVTTALAGGATEQRQVARTLGVSVATLRRRLSYASESFRHLRAQVLSGHAKSLLRDRRHPAEIAERLGFSDERSFSRAFKSWNGITPSAFVGTIRSTTVSF